MTQILQPIRLLRELPQPADQNSFLQGYYAAQQEKRAQNQDDWSQELHTRDRAERAATAAGVDDYLQQTPSPIPSTPGGPPPAASTPAQDAGTVAPPVAQPSSPLASIRSDAVTPAPMPGGAATVSAPVATPPDDGGPPIPPMISNRSFWIDRNAAGRPETRTSAPPTPTAFNLMPGVGDDNTPVAASPMPTRQVASLPTPQMAQDPTDSATAQPRPTPVSYSPPQEQTPPPAPQSALSSITMRPPDRSRLDMTLGRALAHAAPQAAVAHLQRGTQQQFTNYQDETDNALKVLQLADQGQMDQAMLLAQRTGQNVPPALLQNGKARQAMATALNIGKQIGADHDHNWVARFTQNYMQTGDVAQAQRAAGAFQPAPKANTFRPQAIQAGGKTKMGAFDTSTGQVTDSGFEAPPQKTAGAETREKQNFSWMTAPTTQGGLGMDAKQAQQIIFNVKENPGARTRTISTMANALVNSQGMKLDAAIDQATKAYDKIDKMVKGGVDPANNTELQGEVLQEEMNNPAGAPNASGAPAPAMDAQRHEGTVNGRGVYSQDGGKSWYWSDTDTPYDGEFE